MQDPFLKHLDCILSLLQRAFGNVAIAFFSDNAVRRFRLRTSSVVHLVKWTHLMFIFELSESSSIFFLSRESFKALFNVKMSKILRCSVMNVEESRCFTLNSLLLFFVPRAGSHPPTPSHPVCPAFPSFCFRNGNVEEGVTLLIGVGS